MDFERRIAIMQPYFFPYIGYFQLMASVNTFVVFDDVAFINRGWINRNRISVNGDAHMITVPLHRASQNRLICEIELAEEGAWRTKMLRTIEQSYRRAPQFARIFPLVERIVCHKANNLADFLLHGLIAMRDHLGLATRIAPTSRVYANSELKGQERIIDICRKENVSTYVNAAGGKALYDPVAFAAAGFQLFFLQAGLMEYKSIGGTFIPALSIIDVLMSNDEIAVEQILAAGLLT
jgi:hypothetical protein